MSDPTRSPGEPEPTVPLHQPGPEAIAPPDLPWSPSPYEPYAQPYPYGQQPQPHPYDEQARPGPYGQQAQPSPYGQQAQPGPYGQQPPANPYEQAQISPYGQPYPYGQPGGLVHPQPVGPWPAAYQPQYPGEQKSRVAAGLLAIFLGSLGIHNFYLGRTGIAVLQLLLTVLTLGILGIGVSIWALVEGILILTGSPSFRTDARGIPLRD